MLIDLHATMHTSYVPGRLRQHTHAQRLTRLEIRGDYRQQHTGCAYTRARHTAVCIRLPSYIRCGCGSFRFDHGALLHIRTCCMYPSCRPSHNVAARCRIGVIQCCGHPCHGFSPRCSYGKNNKQCDRMCLAAVAPSRMHMHVRVASGLVLLLLELEAGALRYSLPYSTYSSYCIRG